MGFRPLISAVLSLGLALAVQLKKSSSFDDVSWVRPLSTIDALQEAVKEGARYLYADVISDGRTASTSPVLADHSGRRSNVSLIQWLDTIISDPKNVKGIKLMLLETDVFAPVVEIVDSRKENVSAFFVWIGAAILPGPPVANIVSPKPVVDVQKFFDVVVDGLPWVLFSPGWTVPIQNVSEEQTEINGEYTWEDVRDMALLWNCRGVTNQLTFDVWTPLVVKSISKIRWLAKSFTNSTINVWNANDSPPANVTAIAEALHQIQDVPVSFDLPPEVTMNLFSIWVQALHSPSVAPPPTFDDGNWIILPDTGNNFDNGMQCILRPYVTPNTLLVNGYETQALLLINRYQTPATITGNLHVLDSLMASQHIDAFSTVSGVFTVFGIESNQLPHDLSTTETSQLFQILTKSANATYTVRSNMTLNMTVIEDSECPMQIRLQVGAGHGNSTLGYTCEGGNTSTTSQFEGDDVVFGFLFSGWRGFVFDNVTIEVPNAGLKSFPSLSICACTIAIMLYSRFYF